MQPGAPTVKRSGRRPKRSEDRGDGERGVGMGMFMDSPVRRRLLGTPLRTEGQSNSRAPCRARKLPRPVGPSTRPTRDTDVRALMESFEVVISDGPPRRLSRDFDPLRVQRRIVLVPSRTVFLTGATGYLGRPLAEQLLERGHRVRALVRPGSEKKLPPGCQPVVGDALEGASYGEAVAGADVFVHLVGVAHPSPRKAPLFK